MRGLRERPPGRQLATGQGGRTPTDLYQVTIGSTDLHRSERFYRALGLELIVKDDKYLRFACPEGQSTFSVERVDVVPDGEQVTVCFEHSDLDSLVRGSLSRGFGWSTRLPTCPGYGARPGYAISTDTAFASSMPA